MKDFRDKTIVITGAGSGIGQALAINFAKLGANLALNDNNESRIAETKSMLPAGTKVFAKAFDVGNKDAFYSFAEEVNNHYGRVDVVINNAGVAIGKVMVSDLTIEDYEWIMNINLWGVIYGTKAFLPYLRQQKESAIANISSVFGLKGIPTQSGYCITKFAVKGFNESLYLEEKLLKTGLTVSSVHPGGIKTNIARDSRKGEVDPKAIKEFEKSLKTSPEKAAKVIIKGIQKKKHKILIGPDAYAMDIMSRFFPNIFTNLIYRQVKKTF